MDDDRVVAVGAVAGAGDEWWNGRKLKLVLEDNFDKLDLTKWEREVSLWGGGVSTLHPDLETLYACKE